MTVVCIAGMHRSGTSMIARMLNICGISLGDENDLISGENDNPEGFWEHKHFQDLNNCILQSFNGAWDFPPTLQPGWENSSSLDPCRDKAIQLINDIGAATHWGWKDPRNSLTIPFWQKLIPDLKVIICLRSPIEVIQSLKKRGYSSNIFSARLWYSYYEQLLANVQPGNYIITHYANYFYDNGAELKRLFSFLDIKLDKEKIKAAKQFIKLDLKHHKTALSDTSGFTAFPEIIEMYTRLCAQAGPVFQRALLDKKYGTGKQPLGKTIDFMGNQLHEKDKQVDSLQNQLSERDEQVDSLQNQLSERDKQFDSLQNQLCQRDEQVDSLQNQLCQRDEQVDSLQSLLTELRDEKEQAIGSLKKELQEHIGWIANRNELIKELKRELESLHNSVGRKILYPFIFIYKFFNEKLFSFIQTKQFKGKGIKAYRVWRDEGIKSALRNTYQIIKEILFPPDKRNRIKNKSIKAYRVWRDEGTMSALYNAYHASKNFITRNNKNNLQPKRMPSSQKQDNISTEPLIKVSVDDPNFESDFLNVELPEAIAPDKLRARLIAFYLPQYHPIPENDEWWGKGFTEWTNVAKAKPIFPGHQQPNFPFDLGFYDLRNPESRMEQAKLARQYGIEGFCYWHYWFAGKRLLERPFNEVLKSGRPDFPFCLAWANHTWSGIWHGSPDRVLVEQTYPGKKDFIAHFYALADAFCDSRYMKIDKRNIFCIYRPFDLKKAKVFMEIWRKLALKEGIPGFYFVAITDYPWKMPDDGYDAFTTNPPVGMLPYQGIKPLNAEIELACPNEKSALPQIYSYESFIQNAFPANTRRAEFYPCVVPNWDNTPRSGSSGFILHGSTPELYGEHLSEAVSLVADRIPDQKVIFVKSWNEWAETNYLEPDLKWGNAYLEKTLRVITRPDITI